MLRNTRRQHPVGQGFFHSAVLHIGAHERNRLRYVYDCGSIARSPLHDRIDHYLATDGASGKLDILFLSHLDRDHVSGLDRLLAGVRAHTVIIPYLEPAERLAAIGRELDCDELQGSYVQLVADPVRWFSSRGVSRLVFVDGDDRTQGGPVQSPRLRIDMNEIPAIEGFELQFDAIEVVEENLVDGSMSNAGVRRMNHKSPICLELDKRWTANWMFATYVYREDVRVARFKEAINKEFPESPISRADSVEEFSSWTIATLQSHTGRARLKECYEVIAKNHNLTSMSVYSGPCRGNQIAWIGTGDANLKRKQRRGAFENHFGRLLKQVSTMTLPHHGARGNFDPALLQWGYRYVAAAGLESQHGHPHAEVRHSINKVDKELLHVSESDSSEFREDVSC